MVGKQVDRAGDAAILIVDRFVEDHRAAAIPALIGACVMWAVNHGGSNVIKGTLKRAGQMAYEMERDRKDISQ